MKRIFIVFIFLLVIIFSKAQVKSFELSNPEAIELSNEQLQYLTSNKWKVDRIHTYVRSDTMENEGWAYLEYGKDHIFEYGGKKGNWKLIENKYLKHQFNNPEDKSRFNFGGIYAVTNLSDTTVTLTKVLTTTQDMKIDIRLYHKDYYHNKLMNNMHKYYMGDVNKNALDSISTLSKELLLKIGNKIGCYLIDDIIYINTQDSLYRIKRKIN